MTTPRRASSVPSPLARWITAFLPPAAGGAPPVVVAARKRLSGVVIGAFALMVGGTAGFLLVLLTWALPNVPSLVIGFVGGVLIGSAVTVTLASRYPFLRKAGGIAILLAPILVLLAPFLLIGGAVMLLRRTRPRAPVDPNEPAVVVAEVPPPARRPRRRLAP